MATPKLNIPTSSTYIVHIEEERWRPPPCVSARSPQTASGGLVAGLTTTRSERDSFWFQRAKRRRDFLEESDGQRGKPSSNAVAIQKLKKFVAHTRVVTEYLFYDVLKSGKNKYVIGRM